MGQDGKADISLPANAEDMVLAIHVGPEVSDFIYINFTINVRKPAKKNT